MTREVLPLPSTDMIRRILGYNPDSGVLTWLADRGRGGCGATAGSTAGTVDSSGYCRVRVDGKKYLSHRIGWALYYGSEPHGDIDHINRVTTDNRISNLRCVTPSQNAMNRKIQSNSVSGVTGVHWNGVNKKWMSGVTIDGEKRHLGSFSHKDDAEAARYAAAIEGCIFSGGSMGEIIRVDEKVARYVKLRDLKEATERDMKEKIAKVKDAMDSIESELMTFLNETKQESANTKAGTFFKRTTTKCSVADWDVVLPFIQENELWNLLNHAVNKTGVEEYIEINKAVPPGINVTREVAISVNRPKTR